MTLTQPITTENLLHPRQVSELSEAKARLQGILSAPAFVREQLQDGGAMVAKQIKDIDKMLDQAPVAFAADEIDEAVKLEATLRERWSGSDMPTKAEMRRNSPGCVDKNLAWSRRYKQDVGCWKHLCRRLHASGISKHRQADEGDISNIEMFRPSGGSAELSMDNAQIPGTIMKLPPAGAALPAVMSEADRELLAEVHPRLLDQMGTFTNEQRAEVLDVVRQVRELKESAGAGEAHVAPSRSAPRPKRRARAKRPRTPAQLASDARLSETAKTRNAGRRAAKEG